MLQSYGKWDVNKIFPLACALKDFWYLALLRNQTILSCADEGNAYDIADASC
jgi:hypothetical protein